MKDFVESVPRLGVVVGRKNSLHHARWIASFPNLVYVLLYYLFATLFGVSTFSISPSNFFHPVPS